MSSALYRRYRPESFAELIGQSQVTDPLRQALKQDRTHHAYLFSGPRGCGKTTSARILARCLNCEKGPTDTPCGECPSCVELARDGGGSLDVVEIDAASHNGVDDARELRERAVFAPARDRYKIFILDEAHMVTQQGFNALLKIVEEPPEHIKFIFATTEPDKVLTTIRSRTHHYPFRLVAPNELIAYLESVLDTEGMAAEDGVLALVVRAGGGSVRDSLSLLDQLLAGSTGSTLLVSHARDLLGYTSTQVLDDVTQAVAENRPHDLFHHLDAVIHSGGDPKRFVEDFLAHLRDLIVVLATGDQDPSLFPGVPPHDIARLHAQAQLFTPQQLTRMADVTSDTLSAMTGVTTPKLHLEVMMAKLVNPALATQPAAPEATAQGSGSSTPSPPAARPEARPSDRPSPPAAPEVATNQTPSAPPPLAVSAMEPWNLEALVGVWPEVVASLAETKRSLWVAVSQTQPIALTGDVVTIGFVRKADADILRKPQGPGSPLPNADLLRDAISERTGHRVKFTIGQLDTPPVAEPVGEASWPDVSAPGGDAAVEAEKPQPADTGVDSSDSDSGDQGGEGEAAAAPDSPTTGQRGEPAIRDILGGELIGEEVLEAEPGDADRV